MLDRRRVYNLLEKLDMKLLGVVTHDIEYNRLDKSSYVPSKSGLLIFSTAYGGELILYSTTDDLTIPYSKLGNYSGAYTGGSIIFKQGTVTSNLVTSSVYIGETKFYIFECEIA